MFKPWSLIDTRSTSALLPYYLAHYIYWRKDWVKFTHNKKQKKKDRLPFSMILDEIILKWGNYERQILFGLVILDMQVEQVSTPTKFDWTSVVLLLSQCKVSTPIKLWLNSTCPTSLWVQGSRSCISIDLTNLNNSLYSLLRRPQMTFDISGSIWSNNLLT